MRLIDADALVVNIALYMTENAYINDTALDVLKMVAKWTNEAPTIETEPVRHGEWVPYPSDSYRKCSVCGIEYSRYEMILKHKFCPNCGAKMDGKENEA